MLSYFIHCVIFSALMDSRIVTSLTACKLTFSLVKGLPFLQTWVNICCHQALSLRRKRIHTTVLLDLRYYADVYLLGQGLDARLDCRRYMYMNETYIKLKRKLSSGSPDMEPMSTARFEDICVISTQTWIWDQISRKSIGALEMSLQDKSAGLIEKICLMVRTNEV